jgi:hypothetical protein
MSDKITFRKECKKEDGSSKTINIEEVENGFIICIETYTPGNKEGETYKESKWEIKKYISDSNPIEGLMKKDKETSENISDTLDAIFNN